MKLTRHILALSIGVAAAAAAPAHAAYLVP
jgi:hypothetical protein